MLIVNFCDRFMNMHSERNLENAGGFNVSENKWHFRRDAVAKFKWHYGELRAMQYRFVAIAW